MPKQIDQMRAAEFEAWAKRALEGRPKTVNVTLNQAEIERGAQQVAQAWRDRDRSSWWDAVNFLGTGDYIAVRARAIEIMIENTLTVSKGR